FVLRSRTYVINTLFHAVPTDSGDAGWAAAVAYARTLKIYTLAEAAEPRPVVFADVSRMPFPGTPTFDRSYFDYLNQLVQEEPVLEHDKAMMALLSSPGMKKGRPFRPDERLGLVWDRAARDAQRYCIDKLNSRKSVMTRGRRYWPDRNWFMAGINSEAGGGRTHACFSHLLG